MKGSHKAKGTQQKRRPKAKDRHKLANLRKPIQRTRFSVGLEPPVDPKPGDVWIRVSKELDPDGFKLSY